MHEKIECNSILVNAAANSVVREVHSGENVSGTFKYFQNILSLNKDKIAWAIHFVSSEMFGIPTTKKQDLNTELDPINQYGQIKLKEKLECDKMISEGYKILCLGLFNFESPLRSTRFFTKKVISFLHDDERILEIFNWRSQRDFGLATELVSYIVKEMTDKWIGYDFIGAKNPLTIRDFIVKSSVLLEYSVTEHYKKSIEIRKNNVNKVFLFVSNDKVDEQRKFCFSGLSKNSQELAFTNGDNFILQLLNQHDEYCDNTSTWWFKRYTKQKSTINKRGEFD